MRLIDITGQRFGRLLVLQKCPPRPSKQGGSEWECVCDCGNVVIRGSSSLRKSHTSSCGCAAVEWARSMGANREYIAIRTPKTITHGHRCGRNKSPEYKTWLGMKSRCYTPSNKNYPGWGGRGIRVCDRWLNSFENFLSDMGVRPTPEMTIDRLDSNKDYSLDNCRWATMQEQGGENRNGLCPITVGGVYFPSRASACKHFGVQTSVAFMRIAAGIPPEVAVSTVGRMKSRRSKESYLPKHRRAAQP